MRQQESTALCRILEELIAVRNPASVLACLPHPSEPLLTPFLQHCLDRGIRVAFPRLGPGSTLDFREVLSLAGPWDPHRWGVDQPLETSPPWGREQPALVLVPGLAFSPSGQRLGRGGGYFDRFLNAHPALIVWGVAFSCQVVEQLPVEAQDHGLNGLLLGGDSRILKAGGHLWD